jgi:hypothetical protein
MKLSVIYAGLLASLSSPICAENLKILDLVNVLSPVSNNHIVLDTINQMSPDIIISQSTQDREICQLYETELKNEFPYSYNTSINFFVFSKTPIDYLESEAFDEFNFIIKMAFDAQPYLYHIAHLPSFSNDQLVTLRSYYEATHPYINLSLIGDLEQLSVAELFDSDFELCAKGNVSAESSINEKGNTKTEVKANVQSQDGKHKIEASGTVEKDNIPSGKPKAEAKIKYEYSFEF